jgi:uncharacterized protein with PQ loop repeat
MNPLIEYSGWIGIVIGQCVPWFQIYKILKSKRSGDVATGTYIFLVVALLFYLTHAIDIHDPAFIVAQSLALFSNGFALFLIFKYK